MADNKINDIEGIGPAYAAGRTLVRKLPALSQVDK